MGVAIHDQWVLKSRIVNRDPFAGSTVVETYEGTYDSINGILAGTSNPPVVISAEASWVIDDTGAPKWRLIITTPVGDEFHYYWEMPANHYEEGIVWHPKSTGMHQDLIQVINNAIQAVDEGQFTVTQQVANIQSFIDSGSIDPITDKATLKYQAVQLFLYLYRRKDVGANYMRSQYTIRLTQIVVDSPTMQVSDVGTEKIYTNSQLIGEASINNTPVPPRMIYKIDHLPVQKAIYNVDGVVDPNYVWGWLKLASQERQTPNRRIEITTEWWLDIWSLYAYATL